MADDFWVDVYSDAGDGRALAQDLGDQLNAAVAEAILALAYDWLMLAQEDVPIDTGYLMSTGQVGLAHVGPTDITVPLGYEAPYARAVHEISPHHAQWFAHAGVLLSQSAEQRLANSLRDAFPVRDTSIADG